MTYLVDANVISEPTKPAPNSNVVDWLSANERNLVVDSIILGELCIGILALPRGRKQARLEAVVWGRGANHRLPSMGRHDQPTVGRTGGGFEADGRHDAPAGQYDRRHGAPTRSHRRHEKHAGFQEGRRKGAGSFRVTALIPDSCLFLQHWSLLPRHFSTGGNRENGGGSRCWNTGILNGSCK